MNLFENIIITKIHKPMAVFSKKGRRFSMKNRDSYGLSICVSGQITYDQNGETYVSNSSNIVLLPQNANYKLFCDKEGFFPVINFECENLDINKITLLPIKDSKPYIKEFNSLSNCFLHNNRKLKQFQIFYSILERLGSEQSNSPLSAIITYIEANISNSSISNEFLAKKMGISEVYLRKLFISNLGVTPKQYILELRLKTAQQLLTGTSKTVTEISEKCGFASVYHFCRIFKQKTSLTPLEYSKLHRVYKI